MQGKLQVDFRQELDAATTLDKLEKYVREADAVIALVGQHSGSYPPPAAAEKWAHMLPEGFEQATYTQWEVHFARFHSRPISFYFGHDHGKATFHYESENPPDESDDVSGQKDYALWLSKTLGVDRDYFSSEDQLCRLVLKQSWPIEIMVGSSIEIHPQDMEKLILHFDENIDLFSGHSVAPPDPEFTPPLLKPKNQLNSLSNDYFESSIVEDMPSFETIRDFLSNPRNAEWRKRYANVSKQFRNKYQTHRGDFGAFETIFDDIFNRLRQRGQIAGQDALIYTFLHYMYCSCDLGRRIPRTNP